MALASLMHSSVWQTAGWVMVHFLWVGAAIGLVAAVGRHWLRPNPAQRYAFALACFGALSVTPGIISFCLHSNRLAASTTNQPLAMVAEVDVALPAPLLERVEAAPGGLEASALELAVLLLPCLWLIGAPCTFLIVMTGLVGSERLRQHSRQADRDLAGRCRMLAKELRIRGEVALGFCTRLTSPILVGIVKPMILLPRAALNGWSALQLEMVLLHELAHVRRWDNLVNLLQRIVEAVLFFHPVVWWLSAWIRLEREMCCDQIVVEHTGQPRAYAETLAALVAAEPTVRTGALAMAENALVIRIRRILNLEDRSMRVPTKWFAFGAALPVAALVAIGLYAQNDPPKQRLEGADSKVVEPAQEDKKADRSSPEKGDTKKPQITESGSSIIFRDGGLFGAGVLSVVAPSGNSQRVLVEAYQKVQLRSRTSGVVKAVDVDLGSRVRQGQVLVQLDVPDAELELRLKTALVKQAKAEANRAKSTVRAAQATLQSARALVQEAEASVQNTRANLELRKRELNRMMQLDNTKAVTQQEVDEVRARSLAAQAAHDASLGKYEATKAAIAENVAKVDHADAGVQVAEANLVVAEVGLQRAQAGLQSSQLLAPFDGVVTSRNVDVGTFAQAAGQGNTAPLLTIARTDVVRIVAQVPEADIAKFGANAMATIEIDALPGKKFEGKVSRVAPALDPATRTLRAEIDLRNDGTILPGMSGTVTLKAAQ